MLNQDVWRDWCWWYWLEIHVLLLYSVCSGSTKNNNLMLIDELDIKSTLRLGLQHGKVI